MNDTKGGGAFSISEALRFGWDTTRAHWRPLLALGAVGLFLSLVNQGLSRSGGSGPLLALAVQVLQAALTLAFIRVALRLYDGQPVDLSRPAELVRDFLPYLLTSVLYGLVVLVGLVLLVVPGVVWALKYGLSGFLVVDQALNPVDALRESSRLTKGAKGQLFLFSLALLGVNLLGALALGVGLLMTLPLSALASTHVFRALQQRASASTPTASTAPGEGAAPAPG